jgi:hypothetical protein
MTTGKMIFLHDLDRELNYSKGNTLRVAKRIKLAIGRRREPSGQMAAAITSADAAALRAYLKRRADGFVE